MKLYAVWNITGGFVTSPSQFIVFQLWSPLCVPFSWWPLTLYLSLPSDRSSHQPLLMCNNVKHPQAAVNFYNCSFYEVHGDGMWFHVLLRHFWFARLFQLSPRMGTASLDHDGHHGDVILRNQIYKFSIFETHIFTNLHSYSHICNYSIVCDDFIVCSRHHLCNEIDHIGLAVSCVFLHSWFFWLFLWRCYFTSFASH